MSEEPDIDPNLAIYQGNKKRIKDLFWLADPEKQIYSDEDDDIYVIKQDDKIKVIGYFHGGIRPLFISQSVFKFIKDLKKLCNDKSWTNYQLIIITDFTLRYISHTDAENLPKDIHYFIFKANATSGRFVYELIPQNLNREIEESRSKFRQSKIMPQSEYDPNSEEAIMNAIKNGNGDLYGLG